MTCVEGSPPASTPARKAAQIAQTEVSALEAIPLECHDRFAHNWVTDHGRRILKRLEVDIFPWLEKKSISRIKPQELLAARRIEDRGAIGTAHRVLQNCRQVFRFAVATGRVDRDITVDHGGALAPVKERHHALITDSRSVGGLLRAIATCEGAFVTRRALGLAPPVFVRPGELRHATWSEIDFAKVERRIPAARMKMREQHIVPLPRQAIERQLAHAERNPVSAACNVAEHLPKRRRMTQA